MERLICLLPKETEMNWEEMTDQFKSSLWDIYPDTQVCGVGENDTVIVDGAQGAAIQWSRFSQLQTFRRSSFKRRMFAFLALISPLIFLIALLIASFLPPVGVPFMVLSLLLFQLPLPYYVWKAFGGKVWAVEPCLFGIEGYVPLDVIERKLFGGQKTRLAWSAFGSPLSRHIEGTACRENRRYLTKNNKTEGEADGLVSEDIYTHPIKALDPCSPCEKCMHEAEPNRQCPDHLTPYSARQLGESKMGDMKVSPALRA
jgi:hypothetical protein